MLIEVKDSQYHYYIDNQGRKQGEFKEWHDNGQLVTRAYYINNDLHSEYKTWYDDGKVDLHCFYSHGKLNGEYKSLYPDGGIFAHCFFINNRQVLFDTIPYPTAPVTEEDRLYYQLKHGVQLLPLEKSC